MLLLPVLSLRGSSWLCLLALLAAPVGAEDAWSPGVVPDEWRLIDEIQRYPLLSETPPDLAAACDHPDPIVREATAWALRRKPDEAMLPCIERLLDAPEYAVRFAGLGALIVIDSPAIREPLLRALASPKYSSHHDSLQRVGAWFNSVGLPDFGASLDHADRIEWVEQLRSSDWRPRFVWSFELDRAHIYPAQSTLPSDGELPATLHLPARPRLRQRSLRLSRETQLWWKSPRLRSDRRRRSASVLVPALPAQDGVLSASAGESARAAIVLAPNREPVPPDVYRVQPPHAEGFVFVRVTRSRDAEREISRMLSRARRGQVEAIEWLADQRVARAAPLMLKLYNGAPDEYAWNAARRGIARLRVVEAIPVLFSDPTRSYADDVGGWPDEILRSSFYPDYLPHAERIILDWRAQADQPGLSPLALALGLLGQDASPAVLAAMQEMVDSFLAQPDPGRYYFELEKAAQVFAKTRPERAAEIVVKVAEVGPYVFRDLEPRQAEPWFDRLAEAARGDGESARRLRSQLPEARRAKASDSYWRRPILFGDRAEYASLASIIRDKDAHLYQRHYETAFRYAVDHADTEILMLVAESALKHGDAERALQAVDLAQRSLGDAPQPRTANYSATFPLLPELRAQALADLGRPAEALAEFQRARALANSGNPDTQTTAHFDRLEAYAESLPDVPGLRIARNPWQRIASPTEGFHRVEERSYGSRIVTRRGFDQPLERYAVLSDTARYWVPVGDDRFVAWFRERPMLALYQLGENDPVWRFRFDADDRGRVCVAANDDILTVRDADGKIHFIDLANGWTIGTTEGPVRDCNRYRRPMLSSDDFVAREGGGLAAYSLPDGKLRWRVEDAGSCEETAADDDTVLCYREDGEIRAFNRADGAALWVRSFLGEARPRWNQYAARLVADHTGTNAYAVFEDDSVVAFDPRTGDQAWTWKWSPPATPAFDPSRRHIETAHTVLPFERGVYIVTRWSIEPDGERDQEDVTLLGHNGKRIFQAAAPWVKKSYQRSQSVPFVRNGRLYLRLSKQYEVWTHPAAVAP